MEWIGIISLTLNFIGALLIALSVGALDKKEGGWTTVNDKEYPFVYVKNKNFLRLGLVLLPVGFLLQIIIVIIE